MHFICNITFFVSHKSAFHYLFNTQKKRFTLFHIFLLVFIQHTLKKTSNFFLYLRLFTNWNPSFSSFSLKNEKNWFFKNSSRESENVCSRALDELPRVHFQTVVCTAKDRSTQTMMFICCNLWRLFHLFAISWKIILLLIFLDYDNLCSCIPKY